jgi:hypothetical protein
MELTACQALHLAATANPKTKQKNKKTTNNPTATIWSTVNNANAA